MGRTAMRPIPRGKVSRLEAIGFGLTLAVGSLLLLAFVANLVAAALLGGAIAFLRGCVYGLVEAETPQNIVIGGVAGALPPVIGWTASTGHFGSEPLTLFLIIFLWTPPHFRSLALNRADEYEKAGVPVFPVVSGREITKRQS